jgi:hypothetical protein
MPYSSKSAAVIAIDRLGITGGWVFTSRLIFFLLYTCKDLCAEI